MKTNTTALLFDGECEFCNFWIQFVKKRNSKATFEFYPLQSETGKKLRTEYRINDEIDSVVVIKKNKAFVKSNAALQIVESIGGVWSLLLILWIIPKPIRDWGYDIIAKNRHRLFKSKNCEIH